MREEAQICVFPSDSFMDLNAVVLPRKPSAVLGYFGRQARQPGHISSCSFHVVPPEKGLEIFAFVSNLGGRLGRAGFDVYFSD